MIEINTDYKIKVACSQVSALLKCYSQELLNIYIPKNIIDEINNNSASDYEYDVDLKTFNINSLTEESVALLLLIFNEYLSTKNQKEKIESYLDYCNQTQFSYDNLFKNKTKSNIKNINNKHIYLIVYSNENIIMKIIHKIKNFFKIR